MSISDFSKRYGACITGFQNRLDDDIGVKWARWATQVHADCHELKPVGLFPKPAALPSNLKIRQAQDRLRAGGQSKKARALMGEYNVWVTTILDAECENTGRLVTLLCAYCVLGEMAARCMETAASKTVPPEEAATAKRAAAQWGAAQQEVKRHVVRVWTNGKEWHEPVNQRDELDKLAAWYCRRTDLLPTWLLNGNPVPDSAYEAENVFAGELDDDFGDDEPQQRRRSGNETEPEQFTIPDFSPGSSHD